MDWSYIAGFFDGEGSICRTHSTLDGYTITMCQATREVLDEMRKFLDEEDIESHIYYDACDRPTARFKSHMGLWRLQIHRAPFVKAFLVHVVGLLIVKKPKAVEALATITTGRWKHVTKADVACMRVMYVDGFTQQYIANFLGICHATVGKHLRKESLDARPV